ncbi:MAG: hypothetical protein ACI90V_011597 [Bacillariaceae sp.]|jgi:hypothetical protein
MTSYLTLVNAVSRSNVTRTHDSFLFIILLTAEKLVLIVVFQNYLYKNLWYRVM